MRLSAVAGALAVSLLAAPVSARAQEPGPVLPPVVPVGNPPASPLLPEGHWALEAVWRATALGLLPGYEGAQRLLPREEVRRLLDRAAEAAPEGPEQELTAAWVRRFAGEYPAGSGVSFPPTAQLSAGYARESGRAGPGLGEVPPERTGALPLPDRRGLVAALELSTSIGSHLALTATPALEFGDARLPRFDAIVALGAWQLAAGREPVGYGWGRGGGVLLSGTTAFDRVELSTARPVLLPSVLRYLGPTAFEGFVTRLPGERHPGRPYFAGGRVAIQPVPRLSLALERAAMFGGRAGAVTGHTLLTVLTGLGNSGRENQELSFALRYRLPSEPVLPATVYVEYGTEDAAGALRDVPGYILGAYLPRLPLLPQFSLGLEESDFRHSCCGNPPWYRHYAFPGAWAVDERPLGAPLGGQGSETAVYSAADLPILGVRLKGRFFTRERGEENLFVPGREGRSRGGTVKASWRWSDHAEFSGAWAREVGAGWAESHLWIGGRIFLSK